MTDYTWDRKRKGVKVAVLMSGGVDSSVAASLLHQMGYNLLGITLRLFDETLVPPAKAASAEQSIRDAKSVSEGFGFPHQVLDLRQQFRDLVVEPYQDTYLAGATPNPCVHCNPTIKWGMILNRGLGVSVDRIATGHYARIILGKGGPRLEKAKDLSKDQSYVLWGLNRSWLMRTLLPLGKWTKAEIRNEASRLGLDVADKPESQEACFIDGHYVSHLLEMRKTELARIGEGPIVDKAGKQVGMHQGYYRYTIGQRRGLNISDGHGPYFVIDVKPESNTVVIGANADLEHGGCLVQQVNWLSFRPPVEPMTCTVKIRYNDTGGPAIVNPPDSNGNITIRFIQPRRAVTPGQSAVWYRGKTLWGGGNIERALEVGEARP